MKIAKLIFMFFLMPIGYYVCFHFGWGRDVRAWHWVIGCWCVSLAWGGIHAMNVWDTPFKRAIRTALYLGMIFSLSCLAIIYGWGMEPRSWLMIVVPYAMAASLPPFNMVSAQLLWWRKQPRDEMFDCLLELRELIHSTQYGEFGKLIDIDRFNRHVGTLDARISKITETGQ